MSTTNVLNRRYQLESRPGEETSGGSYLAIDLVTRETVAVKVAPFGTPAAARLEREQQFLKGIRHPSIIQTYDAGRSLDRKQFVVFEHLKAKPLSAVVKESGPLSADRLVGILDQLASAIDAAHAQDIIHGAVCPEHVFIYVDQLGIERCKLAEFGYATTRDDALRLGAAEQGGHPSPAYMSPEQAQRRAVTPGTDVYSLAAVVFFACTGKPPFEGSTAVEVAAASGQPVPKLSDRARHLQISAEVDAAVSAALDPRPAHRPHSAMALADAIRNGFVRPAGGVEGLVAAAQGSSIVRRVGVRSSAPTAVIRPTGGRVQPAASGPSAFVEAATPQARIGQPPGSPRQGIPTEPLAIPQAPKPSLFAEVRLVLLGVLISGGLLWLSFSLS